MDISSKSGYPAGALSNFAPHPFTLDGVNCASMEGFLQSLKFSNPDVQVEVCKLVGGAAKRRGQKRNKAWRREQKLWWRGIAYLRNSQAYQDLLRRAYLAMTEQSPGFRNALFASGNAVYKHSMGSTTQANTVLTRTELCSLLTAMREYMRDNLENWED